MENLKAGDLVKLKSGGPIMTISRVVTRSRIICVWFNNNEQKYGEFPTEALVSVGDAGEGDGIEVEMN